MNDFLSELDNELDGITSDINQKIENKNSVKEVKVENKKPDTKKDSHTNIKKVKKEIINPNFTNPNSPQYRGNKPLKKVANKVIKKEPQRAGSYTTGSYNTGKFASNFPETRFYLPSLRDGYTRYIPIGGNDETGAKNMGMVQYGDDIVLIDCGVQFADNDLHGVNYSIPDVSFLTKYKKNIKGFLITHAHLDHIGALKHILPAIGYPTLYGTKLTIGIVKKGLEEAGFLDKMIFIEVDANISKPIKVGPLDVEFFGVNHSVPDSAGLFITSPGGTTFFHTGDFKIDHTPAIDKPADLDRMRAFGDRGVSLLLSDSTGSTRKGHSNSEKEVGETLDIIVANHRKGRLIIATFSSWISRIQQLIDSADKHGKTIFLSGRSMVENIAIAKELGYLKIKPGIMKKMTPKNTQGVLPHNQIIVTTGSQGEEFSALTRMAEGKHNSIEIIKGDTIVFSSSVVPGNERSVVGIINKLIKLGARVITKDDEDVHTGGHALQEEQKIMLEITRPKYFMPIYGDLYFRHVHKETAVAMGFKEDNVLLLDNGQIVDFAPKNGNVFKSKIKVPLEQIIIDGHGMGTATSHVIKARDKMKKAGVLVINYKVDKKTRAIIGHIRVETRGLVYLEEVRHIHRMIIKKARDIYENTVKDVPDMEEKDLLKIIRTDLEAFLLKRMDREPMLIPMITEV